MDRSGVEPVRRRFIRWVGQHRRAEWVRKAGELPLRRDMVTLLRYIRENRVVGTQSTGNMPLKDVRKVTACFVHPPELDHRLGDRVYRLRSEANLWPLYFLHILAEVGELVSVAPGRRWRVTPDGVSFLGWDPLSQLSFLLTVWWYRVNWLVAYPYEGMGEELPDAFGETVLERLLSLPVGQRIPFQEFADELIESTGLTWTAQVRSARMLLQGSIRRMIVGILAVFGAIEREHEEEPLGKGTITDLVAFEITPLGRVLLEVLAAVT